MVEETERGGRGRSISSAGSRFLVVLLYDVCGSVEVDFFERIHEVAIREVTLLPSLQDHRSVASFDGVRSEVVYVVKRHEAEF